MTTKQNQSIATFVNKLWYAIHSAWAIQLHTEQKSWVFVNTIYFTAHICEEIIVIVIDLFPCRIYTYIFVKKLKWNSGHWIPLETILLNTSGIVNHFFFIRLPEWKVVFCFCVIWTELQTKYFLFWQQKQYWFTIHSNFSFCMKTSDLGLMDVIRTETERCP